MFSSRRFEFHIDPQAMATDFAEPPMTESEIQPTFDPELDEPVPEVGDCR